MHDSGGSVKSEGQAHPSGQAGVGLCVPDLLPKIHVTSTLSSATFTKKVNLVALQFACVRTLLV